MDDNNDVEVAADPDDQLRAAEFCGNEIAHNELKNVVAATIATDEGPANDNDDWPITPDAANAAADVVAESTDNSFCAYSYLAQLQALKMSSR